MYFPKILSTSTHDNLWIHVKLLTNPHKSIQCNQRDRSPAEKETASHCPSSTNFHLIHFLEQVRENNIKNGATTKLRYSAGMRASQNAVGNVSTHSQSR